MHVVVNNQIGFTTVPEDARSSRYCTDVAKMIEAPIFHVNGDDAEAVCHVALLALEFRLKFQRDVVIDMYCYRKHGHNESDEPAFTQPTLYRKIASHPQVSALYAEKLITEGTITAADSEAIKAEYTAAMEAAFEKAKAKEARRKAAKLRSRLCGSGGQPRARAHRIDTVRQLRDAEYETKTLYLDRLRTLSDRSGSHRIPGERR